MCGHSSMLIPNQCCCCCCCHVLLHFKCNCHGYEIACWWFMLCVVVCYVMFFGCSWSGAFAISQSWLCIHQHTYVGAYACTHIYNYIYIYIYICISKHMHLHVHMDCKCNHMFHCLITSTNLCVSQSAMH